MQARNRNELWGRVALDELARTGVRHVVVSPGSRSSPLVLAAAADDRMHLSVQIDERSAAFMALGVGKATGTPAVVVTTSGTAVANLFPAVVEAARSEVPLLVLTADRPVGLRGSDANQTIDQVEIFGSYPRLFLQCNVDACTESGLQALRRDMCRAVTAALGDPGGPVHVNVPFDKPLEPTPVPDDVPGELARGETQGASGRSGMQPWERVVRTRVAPEPDEMTEVGEVLRRARRPLLIAGPASRPWDAGPAARRMSSALGIPLLADALSGARFPASEEVDAPLSVGGYDVYLRSEGVRAALRPDCIVRIGPAPTSATLCSWWTQMDGVPHLWVRGGSRWWDHTGMVTREVRGDPVHVLDDLARIPQQTLSVDPDWAPMWMRAEDAGRGTMRTLEERGRFEGALVAEATRLASADDLLFVSSSMPVRDLDAFSSTRDAPLTVLGNRGASGIDGIVSTAAGVSLGTGRRVVAVVGDLAFLHDSNGLAAMRDPRIRVLLVVLNNDGGGIFHFLPIRDHEPAFTPLVVAPHGRNLAHLAAFHDLSHVSVEYRPGTGVEAGSGDMARVRNALKHALGRETSAILEIRTDRNENRRLRDEAVATIARAAENALKT